MPKKHLTRKEYQSYLNEYLSRRYTNNGASWKRRQNNNWRNGDNRSPAVGTMIGRTATAPICGNRMAAALARSDYRQQGSAIRF